MVNRESDSFQSDNKLTGKEIAMIFNACRYQDGNDWRDIKAKYTADYLVLENEQFFPTARSAIDTYAANLIALDKIRQNPEFMQLIKH